MKFIKWGFIGCGEVTEKKSGPAFNEVEGSHIEAVMSRNEQKARSYAERHGVSHYYTDPQKLIDNPDVNAIYIATPPSSHATFAIMAMKAGKPVYVEKPLAASYDDCARINRISEQTGVPCFVAYYRRCLPYFLKVKSIVDSGVIGKPVNVQVRFSVPPREQDYRRDNLPWRLQPDIAGGGYFYDLAPHQLDLLQQMFGVIVDARGYKDNRGGLYEAEDTVSACFRFENGLPGSGSWCFVAHESAREDRIEIIGNILRVSPCRILLTCSSRSSRMSWSICKDWESVSVPVYRLRRSTGPWIVSWENSDVYETFAAFLHRFGHLRSRSIFLSA